jgi:hypothetical protein
MKMFPMVTLLSLTSPKETLMFPTCAGSSVVHNPKCTVVRTETVMFPMLAPIGPVPTETGPPDTVGAGREMDGTVADGVMVVTDAVSEVEAGPDDEDAWRRCSAWASESCPKCRRRAVGVAVTVVPSDTVD